MNHGTELPRESKDSEKKENKTNGGSNNHGRNPSPKQRKSLEKPNFSQNISEIPKHGENKNQSKHGRSNSPKHTRSKSPRYRISRSPKHGRTRSPVRPSKSQTPKQRKSRSPRERRSKSSRRGRSRSPRLKRIRSPDRNFRGARENRFRYFPRRSRSPKQTRVFRFSNRIPPQVHVHQDEFNNPRSAYVEDEVQYQTESDEHQEFSRSSSFHYLEDQVEEEEQYFANEDYSGTYSDQDQGPVEMKYKQVPLFKTSHHRADVQYDAHALIQNEQLSEDFGCFSGDANQSAMEWLQAIEDCGKHRKWDSKIKVFKMTSSLVGFARSWYIGLEDTNFDWNVWKEKLIKAFPCDQDYDKQLHFMLLRKKQSEETIEKYFYQKLAMLNACNITGRRAVACILGGIRSKYMVKEARLRNFDSTDNLYEFLSNFKFPQCPTGTKPNQPVCAKCKVPGHSESTCLASKKMCYICMSHTHAYDECPQKHVKPTPAVDSEDDFNANPFCPKSKKRKGKKPNVCTHCYGEGHLLNKCPFISDEKKVDVHGKASSGEVSEISIMYGCFKDTKCYSKFFIDVCVNGSILKGYIDATFSAHVTIRQEEAVRLNLIVRKSYKMIQGYGYSNISTHGEVDVNIRVDLAVANILAYVVPDHIQAIAVIVGKSFVNLPHVFLDTTGKQIRILQHFAQQHLVQQQYPVNNSVVYQPPVVCPQPVVYQQPIVLGNLKLSHV